MAKKAKKEDFFSDNKFGLIGIATGWLIPIAGIIFGIISLVKKEKKWVGILSIVIASFFFVIAAALMFVISILSMGM